MDKTFSCIMMIFLLYLGVSALINFIKLRRDNLLFPSKTLYPGGDCSETNCADPEGYIDYILPHQLIMAIGCFLFVIVEALCVLGVLALPAFAPYVLWGLELGLVVYLAIVYHHAAKLFW